MYTINSQCAKLPAELVVTFLVVNSTAVVDSALTISKHRNGGNIKYKQLHQLQFTALCA